MPEDNGTERDARVERIEKMQETFRRDAEILLTAQVIQQGEIKEQSRQIDKLSERLAAETQEWRERSAVLDARVDKQVVAIGELIKRLPRIRLDGLADQSEGTK